MRFADRERSMSRNAIAFEASFMPGEGSGVALQKTEWREIESLRIEQQQVEPLCIDRQRNAMTILNGRTLWRRKLNGD